MWLREGGGTKGERILERQTEANHKALSPLGRLDECFRGQTCCGQIGVRV